MSEPSSFPSPSGSPIGARIPIVDSVDKVTGSGKYTDDLTLPGMLVGKILHSPHAHARIRSINTAAAERLPGVFTVVTGRETPVKYGILPIGHDETIFAVDKVLYIGDNVAGVAAETETIAEEALRLIRVDYEILPAYFDPEKSMLAEQNLIHEDRPHNIEKDYHHHFGDVQAGFAAAGGTDLIPSMKQGLFAPPVLLDLKGIRELDFIRFDAGGSLAIGALARITTIVDSPVIAQHFPVLHEAAKTIASPLLRNMGTLGSNLCLDTRCLYYNQSTFWREALGGCIKKDGSICHVAPGRTEMLGGFFR
jgi:hypothetical protein